MLFIYSERWDNDDLRKLLNIKSTDFEVVQIGLVQIGLVK